MEDKRNVEYHIDIASPLASVYLFYHLFTALHTVDSVLNELIDHKKLIIPEIFYIKANTVLTEIRNNIYYNKTKNKITDKHKTEDIFEIARYSMPKSEYNNLRSLSDNSEIYISPESHSESSSLKTLCKDILQIANTINWYIEYCKGLIHQIKSVKEDQDSNLNADIEKYIKSIIDKLDIIIKIVEKFLPKFPTKAVAILGMLMIFFTSVYFIINPLGIPVSGIAASLSKEAPFSRHLAILTGDAVYSRTDKDWRMTFANLVHALSEAGAAVIAFDIVLKDEEDRHIEKLAAAIREAAPTKVIFAHGGSYTIQKKLSDSGAEFAFACLSDYRIAKACAVPWQAKMSGQGIQYLQYGLSYEAVRAYKDYAGKGFTSDDIGYSYTDRFSPKDAACDSYRTDEGIKEMTVNHILVPLAEISVLQKPGHYYIFDKEGIYRLKENKEMERISRTEEKGFFINPENVSGFRDKIVIAGIQDEGDKYGEYFGAELHANAVNAILSSSYIRPHRLHTLFSFLFLLLTGMFIPFSPRLIKGKNVLDIKHAALYIFCMVPGFLWFLFTGARMNFIYNCKLTVYFTSGILLSACMASLILQYYQDKLKYKRQCL
ncbi:MAG: CHASE2 domain-containing protein [Desulfococcaceae bacterium]|jgi:hypothetical protein|nr:CHASE2 domain-containing protein [Desulfococcaceae bacterium]